MYMNSSLFEFNKMSTVATTILASLEAAGVTVNYLRCWDEPYHVTHMNNPFHKYVRETYRGTRSEYMWTTPTLYTHLSLYTLIIYVYVAN